MEIPKCIKISFQLNEQLRRYCFDTKRKEASVMREALHEYLERKSQGDGTATEQECAGGTDFPTLRLIE